MNPLRGRLVNVGPFDRVEFEYPAGASAIVGVNGAGKSTLANATDWALFGPTGRSWAPHVRQGEDTLEIELEFEHAGELYRARRGYSARGAGKSTFDLERENGDGWQPLTKEDQRETQRQLELLLGLTRETWRASAMLAQGDGDAWTAAKPADRKRVLAHVLGLGRFDEYRLPVTRDRLAAEQQIQRLTGALERADLELAEKPHLDVRLQVAREMAADAARDRGAAQRALDEAGARTVALDTAETVWRTRVAAAEAARAHRDAAAKTKTDADLARPALATVQAELAQLAPAGQTVQLEQRAAELEAELAGYRQAVAAREQAQRDRETARALVDALAVREQQAKTRAAGLREKIAHLESGKLDSCPTCEQTLGADARAAAVRALAAEGLAQMEEANRVVDEARAVVVPEVPGEPEPPVDTEAELASVRERVARARADELQRSRLEERARALEATVAAADRPDYREALAVLERELADAQQAAAVTPEPPPDALAEAKAAALAARARVDQERERHDAAKAEEVRAEEALARLARLAEESAADRAERDRLRGHVDDLILLEQAYGRDGVPALMVSTTIPALETTANRVLADGFRMPMQVELRQERVKKDGALADALDLVVSDMRGARDYPEGFSGSEGLRVALALRIALAHLLGARGADSRVLILDEPEQFMDPDRRVELGQLIRNLVDTRMFERVLVVTHEPELLASCDQQIRVVVGDDGLSRIAA